MDFNLTCTTISCAAGEFGSTISTGSVVLLGFFVLLMFFFWAYSANFPKSMVIFFGALILGWFGISQIGKISLFMPIYGLAAIVVTVLMLYAFYKTIKTYVS